MRRPGAQPPRESQLKELLQASRVFLTAPPSWCDTRRHRDAFDAPARTAPMGTPLAAISGG